MGVARQKVPLLLTLLDTAPSPAQVLCMRAHTHAHTRPSPKPHTDTDARTSGDRWVPVLTSNATWKW